MQISELCERVQRASLDFAWGQWSQMGVFGTTARRDRWAADPEALLLFTLEAARDDARLFDEVLDWLTVNLSLVSHQRLRNLFIDDRDPDLVGAALSWASQSRGRRSNAPPTAHEPRPLFRRIGHLGSLDPVFLEWGWERPPVKPSGNSAEPDSTAPVNLAFQLRRLLGVGAKAEVMRLLLTTAAPTCTPAVIAGAAAYSKRNVQEALTAFAAAGVVDLISLGTRHSYALRRDRVTAFLGIAADDIPQGRDWPQLLGALRRLLRWLLDNRDADTSEYLRASSARAMAGEISPLLRYAGVPTPGSTRTGADYWQDFVSLALAAVAALD